MMNKSSQESRVETISEQLSLFALNLKLEQIPISACAQAKLHMLDAIGIGIASSHYDFAKNILHALMSLQESNDQHYQVLGVPNKLSMRDAILVNGTYIHGLDFDDTHAAGVIHASSSAMAALLSVGQRHNINGQDGLVAYLVAIEVASRIASAANGGFHEKGFHPTGLVGIFGATVLDELACSDLQQCFDAGELNLKRLALLSVDRIDNLLRYWVVEKIGSYPSQAQLHQLHQQMLHAASDTHPQIVLGQWVLLRERDHLIVRAQAEVNQPPIDAVSVVWRGERHIDIPEWRGQLQFEDGKGEGFDRELLMQGPLTLRPRQGGERLKLDRLRPSRSLKNLFQESGVAAGRRPWLPLLYAGDQLLFACGLGPNCIAAQKNPGVRVHWQAWNEDNSRDNS